VWVPVVVSALFQFGTTFGALATGSFRGGPPWLHHAARFDQPAVVVIAAVVLALVGPVLLVWIRDRPGPVLVGIAASAVLGQALLIAAAGGVAFYLSVIFAVVIAVWHGARVWAWVVTGVLWLTPIALYLLNGSPASLFLLVPWTVVSIAVLVIPEAGRNRRAWRAQQLRDAEARRAEETQAERVRIARELHDVLAHSLSQINVQASVGLHLFDTQPEAARDALASIKESSKRALGDVRQVLGMLRGDAPLTPEPGLVALNALIDDLDAHGIDGELKLNSGADVVRVPAAVQQAAYRIVQEALTNVAKHASARHAWVEVLGNEDRLRVAVRDDGVGAASVASLDGRGLLGMRERAELLGGTFAAGPRAAGGFEVTAELPFGGAR
jgi:signal transduction histidine kinase